MHRRVALTTSDAVIFYCSIKACNRHIHTYMRLAVHVASRETLVTSGYWYSICTIDELARDDNKGVAVIISDQGS